MTSGPPVAPGPLSAPRPTTSLPGDADSGDDRLKSADTSAVDDTGPRDRTMLRIRNLSVTYLSPDGPVRAVEKVSLEVAPGECVGIIGESGSGKTTLGRSMLGLIRNGRQVRVDGTMEFRGQDLLRMSASQLRDMRGRLASIVFQDALSSLNPVITTGQQIDEAIKLHQPNLTRRQRRRRVLDLYDQVGIADAQRAYRLYPHQMSGGMRQRVLIAMAVANQPDLIVADEPTTALDVTVQAQILDLLRGLQRDTGCGLVLISHNLAVVGQLAQRVMVMYAGRVSESSDTALFFGRPRHPYSAGLLNSVPRLDRPGSALVAIPGAPPSGLDLPSGCAFHPRCARQSDVCVREVPPLRKLDGLGELVACHFPLSPSDDGIAPQLSAAAPDERDGLGAVRLQAVGLRKQFPAGERRLRRRKVLAAVDGVDVTLHAGRTVAVVGESGSGKSTLARCLLGLARPDDGTIVIDGTEISKTSGRAARRLRSPIQIVFQDSYASLDPLWRIGESVAEPLRAADAHRSGLDDAVAVLLDRVGLSERHALRYPRELSGGQRARAAIARALAAGPEVLVLDEPTSSMDASVQAQIVNLLHDIQRDSSTAYLLISHDIGLVRYMADEVLVMYQGRIVERGPCAAVLSAPKHEYTRHLLAAVPAIPGGEPAS